MASKRIAVLIRNHLSVAGRSENLRRGIISDLCKSLFYQSLDQSDYVTLTAVGFDLVLAYQGVANRFYGSGLLDEFPDPSSHGIQTVVCSPLEIQYRYLAS